MRCRNTTITYQLLHTRSQPALTRSHSPACHSHRLLLSLALAQSLSLSLSAECLLCLGQKWNERKSQSALLWRFFGHAYACRRSERERYPVISVHQKCLPASERDSGQAASECKWDKYSQEGWFLTFERATSLLCQHTERICTSVCVFGLVYVYMNGCE